MKALLKTIILIILAGGFGVFFVPVVIYGVFNVGNIAGMALSGTAFLLALFGKRVKERLQNTLRRPAGRVLTGVAAVFLVMALALAAVTGARIVRAARNAPAGDGDYTVVVLGCRVYGSGPSLMLCSRIDAAYAYLCAHPEAKCVLSGGQGEDEPESEAQCMFDALTARGIAPERLYREDASTSTRENLAFSLEIIRESGLPEKIALVTNEYHQYRASLMAAALGVKDCRAVSAPSQRILLPTYFMRELFGVADFVFNGEKA